MDSTDLNDMVFKTTPFEHQKKALRISRDVKSFALLMEMGTAKSFVTIMTASWLFSRGQINGLLVVAPKSICRTWSEEQIPKHLPDNVDRRIVIWGPPSKSFKLQLDALFASEPLKLHILIVNIEALGTDRCYDSVEKFLRGHDALFAIDESTTIKNHSAQRTKIAIKLGKIARYRRIMTGTPVTQSPIDVYSQFQFLEDGCLGSTSYYGFRNHYAVLRKRYVNGRSFDEVVGYQRLEELQAAVNAMSYRVLKKDCLDLPDKIYEVRRIELTSDQLRYYKELREEAMTMLTNGDVITAPLVITQLLRLRQALCNIAPKVEGEAAQTQWISDVNPRADEVMNILEEAGDQKVIVWCNFIPSIRLLHERIIKTYGPGSVGCIYGAVTAKDRQAVVSDFQDPAGSTRFIVAQPRTGGYGLTLTAATLVVYHDNDWSLEVRQQSEDRAHRIGQTSSVTYIDVVAPETVDEKIRDALLQKRDLADQVTGDTLRQLIL